MLVPTALLAVALGAATTAHADEEPKRPEKHESDSLPPPSVRLPTLLGGLAFTAAWWGLGTGTAYLRPDAPGFSDLRKPVIGPFQAIAHNGCDPDCDFLHYFQFVYFALSGIAQAGGVGVALESLLVPTSRGERRPTTSAPPTSPEKAPTQDEPTGPAAPPPPPPSGPMFYLPQPIQIGRGGWGIGVGGLF